MTFNELLKKNGFSEPKRPTSLLGKFFFQKQYNEDLENFRHDWQKSERYFNELKTLVENSEDEDLEAVLKNLTFESPRAAESTIWCKTKDFERKIAQKNLTSFISKVSAGAPKGSLMVLKDKGYHPYEFNAKKFEQSVKKREKSCLCMMFFPVWVIFDPKNYDPSMWLIDPQNAEYEFI